MLASQGHYQVIGSRPIVKVERSSSCVMCRRMDSSASFCAEDAEEPDKAAALSIEQQWVVRFTEPGKKTRTWVPTVEKHGPLVFCKLQKFDRQFVMFATGQSLDNKGINCNTKGFDGILGRRRAASIQAIAKAREPADASEKCSAKRKITTADSELLNEKWVLVELEELECESFTSEEANKTAKCLWGLQKTDLWIEFTAKNLLYMRALIRRDLAQKQLGEGEGQEGSPKKSPTKKRKVRSPKLSPRHKLRRTQHHIAEAQPRSPQPTIEVDETHVNAE